MGTSPYLSAIFTKGDNFHDLICFPGQRNPSTRGSTLKGSHLLLKQQILSFKGSPQLIRQVKMKMTVASPESEPIHYKVKVPYSLSLFTRSGNMLSFLLPLFQEGQLSVTGESMCTKYWLTA